MKNPNIEFNQGDNRKQEFLVTALKLFHEKGYEKTTIKDIIAEMEVSKGAFYHYFESKEDVIVTLAKVYADKAINIITNIANRTDLSAIEKINQIFQSVNAYKGSSEATRFQLKDAFYGEENLKLEKKIFDAFKEPSIDLFQQIIDEGVQEGSIEEPVCSRELAEFLLYTIKGLNTSIDTLVYHMKDEDNNYGYKEFIASLDKKLRTYEAVFTKVLNLQEGSIKLRESYLNRFDWENEPPGTI